jgi:cell division protein FtsX
MRQHVQRSEERWALALQRELHAVMRVLEVARYAVTTAAVNFWRHRTMSAAAVFAAVVMMLMLNGFAVVVSHLNVTLTALDQKVNLVIYLKD